MPRSSSCSAASASCSPASAPSLTASGAGATRARPSLKHLLSFLPAMTFPLATLNEIMGLPKNASEHGPTIDHALEFCHWFMLALFLGWFAYFLYVIFRFHRTRHPKANYHGVKSKISAHIEFSVIVIEAILL